jgi:dipeptidase E
MTQRLLLLSNSTNHGQAYLGHCEDEIRRHFGSARRVLFVPFALQDHAGYAAKARERFEEMGLELDSLHTATDPVAAVSQAEGMFVGGGNTFRLLLRLQEAELLDSIRARVKEGMPYMGASAGTNMAGPTIKTTNDMPIVQPHSFQALGLVSYQINPHYLDPDPGSTHMGETRETRIREFLEENDACVVGLREGGWLEVSGAQSTLRGPKSARVFRRDQEPLEVSPGSILEPLI